MSRNRAAFDFVRQFKARAALQRLDAQGDLAELAGASALLLVPIARLGDDGDRLPIRDTGRRGVELQVPARCQLIEHDLEVLLAQTTHHRAAFALIESHLKTGVLLGEASQCLGQLLFVGRLARHQRKAKHRLRKGRGREVKEVLVVRVVQHGVARDLVDAGHRAQVARHGLGGLDRSLALHAQQMRHLEGLASVTDEEL